MRFEYLNRPGPISFSDSRPAPAERASDNTYSERDPLIVIVNPEGLAERGGMGRMTRYLIGAIPGGRERIAVYDSRGPRAITMPFYLARCLGQILCARRSGRLRLVHINMAENASVLRKGAVVLLCRFLHVPTILHLHAGRFIEFAERLPPLGRYWLRLIFAKASHTIVLGSLWKTYLHERLGLSLARISVIPNGVPAPRLCDRAQQTTQCRLIFIGKLRPEKGLNELMNALASPRLSALSWSLTVVGDGRRTEYEAMAARLGLSERICFTGWLSAAAVHAALADASVFVLPSHYEGMPLAVLESMAAGLAVIATTVGALPEMLQNNETALLVPPQDEDALETALYRLIVDPQLRRRLAAAGQEHCARDYTVEQQTAAILALYERVAPERG